MKTKQVTVGTGWSTSPMLSGTVNEIHGHVLTTFLGKESNLMTNIKHIGPIMVVVTMEE